MKWILLIYCFSYGWNRSITTIEFKTQKECEAAKTKILENDKQWTNKSIDVDKTTCLELIK